VRLQLDRLRSGEVIASASALLLAVFLFALPWYGADAHAGQAAVSIDGWDGLTHVRWLVVVTIVAALALAYFQAVLRPPAVPVTMSAIVTVLGLLTTLALIYRVLLNPPGTHLGQRPGAFLGLACALGIVYGAFRSLREEGIRESDGPGSIERVTLERGKSPSPS
jgi:hypothetical protein